MAKHKNLQYFQYLAKVVEVVDGDTWNLNVAVGFKSTFQDNFRMYQFDCPETTWRAFNQHEYEHGVAATAFVKELLDGKTVAIQTYKSRAGAYGRWEATVYTLDGNYNIVDDLADLLDLNNLRKLTKEEYANEVVLKPFIFKMPVTET